MKRGLEEGGAPYKPLPPERLYLTSGEWEQRLEKRPTGQLYPFDAPGGPNITVVDLGGRPGRDFAPERAQAAQAAEHRAARSEEPRVGKECGRTCRSRWSPFH